MLFGLAARSLKMTESYGKEKVKYLRFDHGWMVIRDRGGRG